MESFLPIRFKTAVQLAPSELHKEFEQAIVSRLRRDLEGVCTRYGYIRPNSIEILRRSAGGFVKQHFNGHIRFELVCKAEVCNPPQGLVVKAVVKVKNEMGVLAESSIEMDGQKVPVLDIIVPLRSAGITSEIDLEPVQVGEEIYVSVLSKRYQLKDKKISVIGRAVRAPAGPVQAEGAEALGIEDGIDRASVGSFEDDELDEEDDALEGGSDDEFVAAAKKPPITAVKAVFVGGEDDEEESEAQAEEEGEYDAEDDDFYDGGDEEFDAGFDEDD
jgi:DNA-directed RNA polymerase subunit E'/Rpb7